MVFDILGDMVDSTVEAATDVVTPVAEVTADVVGSTAGVAIDIGESVMEATASVTMPIAGLVVGSVMGAAALTASLASSAFSAFRATLSVPLSLLDAMPDGAKKVILVKVLEVAVRSSGLQLHASVATLLVNMGSAAAQGAIEGENLEESIALAKAGVAGAAENQLNLLMLEALISIVGAPESMVDISLLCLQLMQEDAGIDSAGILMDAVSA